MDMLPHLSPISYRTLHFLNKTVRRRKTVTVANPSTHFDSIKVGALHLSRRVVTAPLTGLRSEPPGDVPGPLMAEHYGQRASASGLGTTESAPVLSRLHVTFHEDRLGA